MSKTILITGASRGIGRATAALCGERGWNVVIGYASNSDAAASCAEAVCAAGGQALAIRCNVRSESQVIAAFDAAIAHFGPLDGVVNNAGIVAPKSDVASLDLDRMRTVFDTNVLGAFLVAREAARRIVDGGSIVNISSVAARLGSPNEYVDYAASKGAIDTLTIGLAQELAPRRIRVSAVRPGLIETGIHASGGQPDRAKRLGAATPLGRAGTAREIGESIVWLLSDAASYVTGTLLDVSGGR